MGACGRRRVQGGLALACIARRLRTHTTTRAASNARAPPPHAGTHEGTTSPRRAITYAASHGDLAGNIAAGGGGGGERQVMMHSLIRSECIGLSCDERMQYCAYCAHHVGSVGTGGGAGGDEGGGGGDLAGDLADDLAGEGGASDGAMCAAGGAAESPPAVSVGFPAKPVRVVVSSGPGAAIGVLPPAPLESPVVGGVEVEAVAGAVSSCAVCSSMHLLRSALFSHRADAGATDADATDAGATDAGATAPGGDDVGGGDVGRMGAGGASSAVAPGTDGCASSSGHTPKAGSSSCSAWISSLSISRSTLGMVVLALLVDALAAESILTYAKKLKCIGKCASLRSHRGAWKANRE